MISSTFLIGGGWQSETFPETYGRFLQAATKGEERRIAIVVAEERGADARQQFQRFFTAFAAVGLQHTEAIELIVSGENPLTKERFIETEATGIFVCGGLTPAYFDALCVEQSWLELLGENQIPYGGFSAGASVAAEQAIIGGWRRRVNNQTIEIVNENAGEDLDHLDVRRGLGLVPFAVDVHASQWGTLSRLAHTIDARLAAEGWAIDENTMLEISETEIFVSGAGSAYRISRAENRSIVDIFQTGEHISLG